MRFGLGKISFFPSPLWSELGCTKHGQNIANCSLVTECTVASTYFSFLMLIQQSMAQLPGIGLGRCYVLCWLYLSIGKHKLKQTNHPLHWGRLHWQVAFNGTPRRKLRQSSGKASRNTDEWEVCSGGIQGRLDLWLSITMFEFSWCLTSQDPTNMCLILRCRHLFQEMACWVLGIAPLLS